MKYKKTLAVVISLVASYFAAYPVGHLYDSIYPGGGTGWVAVGPFPGYWDGFLFSYVLLSSFLVVFISGRIKYGFYAVLPVLVIDIILAAFDPQLWMDLILLGLGLVTYYYPMPQDVHANGFDVLRNDVAAPL